jgi:hypothetical protein
MNQQTYKIGWMGQQSMDVEATDYTLVDGWFYFLRDRVTVFQCREDQVRNVRMVKDNEGRSIDLAA